jgi:hypothetical protein
MELPQLPGKTQSQNRKEVGAAMSGNKKFPEFPQTLQTVCVDGNKSIRGV